MKNQAQQAAASAEQSASDASSAASAVSSIVPSSAGTTGQVLTKAASGAEWADKYPSSGTAGQVLTKTATGEAWEDVDGLPAGGITGQVLTKNSSTDGDASWQTTQNDGIWGSIIGTLSDQTDLQNALNAKANTSTLATVESSSSASKAYAEGDYLVYNGQLYKVTAEIVVGDTLTVGTNIESTTVGSQLSELSEMHYRNYEALETEYATVNASIVDTSKDYTVEIWNRSTEAYVQVSFNLKTAVSNSSTAVVLNFTSKITELIHPTYRVYPGFIESGTYAGRSCVLHLNTWSDTKVLDMYNVLGGNIAAGTRLTFAFYVMQ